MQGKTITTVVLGLVGVYFLVFHTSPLPLNHEAIGLGNAHVAHGIFGIILIAVAVYMWRKSKKTNSQT